MKLRQRLVLFAVAASVAACSSNGSGTSDVAVPGGDAGGLDLATADTAPDAEVGPIADASKVDLGEPACGTWSPGPSLVEPREQSPAFLLPSGLVLVVAGHSLASFGGFTPVDSSELIDVDGNVSTVSGSFTVTRDNNPGVTVMLADGRVMSADPYLGNPDATTEIWDPATGLWETSGRMGAPGGRGILLADGRVLVSGGIDWPNNAPRSRTELFDSATGTWTPGAEMTTPRIRHGLVRVGDKVLAAGGFATYPSEEPIGSSELWDPATETWGEVAQMNGGLGELVVLEDGRVLTVGGMRAGSTGTEVVASEVYDPATNTWGEAASLRQSRWGATATRLADGRVLATGGAYGNGSASNRQSAEIYDPASDVWMSAGDMETPRRGHSAVLLSDGRVLVIGGFLGRELSTTEIYEPCAR